MKTRSNLARTAALEIRKIRTAVNDIIGNYSSSVNSRLSDAIKAAESSYKKIPLKKSELVRLKWIIKKAAGVKIKPAKGRPKDLTKVHKFSLQVLARLRDRVN